MSDLNGKTIENWVASECPDIQGAIDSARIAIDQRPTNEHWRCGKEGCPVFVGMRRSAMRRGLQLVNTEKCLNIPPLPNSE